jgi:hypothetical protein
MANPSWLTIYRAYTTPELQGELTRLREQVANPFSSTGAGGASASRDMALLTAQLDGATQAMNERRGNVRRRTFATC